jgi:predicted TPR repeat methyltransferase
VHFSGCAFYGTSGKLATLPRLITNDAMTRSPTRKKPATHKISIDDAMQMAIAVHQGGNPRLASEHYGAILQAVPDHPDAMHYLGVASWQLGKQAIALRQLARALELAPANADARNNLGNMQKESGLHAEAEASYRAVIDARPGFALAHNNLGVVLKAQGRPAEAIACYRTALALAPALVQGWVNLGNAHKAQTDYQDALSAYRQAIMLEPQHVEAHRNLGRALVAFGRPQEALEVYRQWQSVEPENPVVAHLIAACAGAQAPERASDQFVQQTFDRFAGSFDQVLQHLDYRAPALCGELLATLAPQPHALDILDAGCGTGLCAPYLAPFARTLHGVDLSPGMLAKARLRGGYDQLHEAELTAWLAAHPAHYDLIVSADTLCYFGALDAALAAAAGALRRGGQLVFTVEESDADAPPFTLHPHGRYSHRPSYVSALLTAAGLQVSALRQVTLRMEAKLPVGGLLVAATRPA